jgi:predicted enzyme related to lactoylglutathione lyase
MPSRLYEIVIDAADPAALARWWAGALGWQVVEVTDADDGELEVDVAESEDGPLFLTFVTAADEKRVKNRIHLDLASDSLEDQASLVERLLASGATRVDVGQGEEPGGVPWVVLADPEGNEFCVLSPRDSALGPSARR